MPRLIVHGFTTSLGGLFAALIVFMQSACSSLNDDDAWIHGQWKGAISNSCRDSAEMTLADSIFLHFGPEGRLQMRKSRTQPYSGTTYFTLEDEVVIGSLFGSAEKRLNMEGGNGDTLELGISESDCFHLYTLVRVDSLQSH